MIQLFVPGPPVAQSRPRFARIGNGVRTYDKAESRDFKTWVKTCAYDAKIVRAQRHVPLNLSIQVQLLKPASSPKSRKFPVTRPDADNYLKGILDGLNGVAWEDDAQIVKMEVLKVYHDTPGVSIKITECIS